MAYQYQQLTLFSSSMIHCSICGQTIRDLNELRTVCPLSIGDIHSVTKSEYFVLYRKTETPSLTASIAR